ncbi:helix-turn-helix domain-containing protein [Mycolicibacterium fortuitum]|nr:helix-turn-helix domain-containing protein [Mycolicibacterium fortuitum]
MSKSASVKDVAADLGISEGTVRRWLAQGRISGVRIGPKLIRLDLDQVKHELYGTAYSA